MKVAAYCPDFNNATTLADSLRKKGHEVVAEGWGEDLNKVVESAVEKKAELIFTTQPYAPHFRRRGLRVMGLKPRKKLRVTTPQRKAG